MLKHTVTAAALAAALATPAFAQSANPTNPSADKPAMTQTAPATTPSTMPSNSAASNKGTFIQSQNATDWRGSKLIGATIYGPDNASIGDINEMLVANDGSISGVVVGVGGFLGVGEKTVAIPFDALTITRKPNSDSIDKVTVRYTKDELKSAPKFAYFEPSRPTTTGSGATAPMRPAPTPMSPSTNR